ncbi:MAG: FtsB family cell division protein [Nitrospiraceae bacterium]
MTRRNRSRSPQHRRLVARRILLIGFVFGIVLLGSFFFDEMGVPKYFEMRRHAQQLELDIRELERTNAGLRTDIHQVQHDPARIEELARERLGFVRKGETVYQLVEKPANGK